jgi:hypothetical protein
VIPMLIFKTFYISRKLFPLQYAHENTVNM